MGIALETHFHDMQRSHLMFTAAGLQQSLWKTTYNRFSRCNKYKFETTGPSSIDGSNSKHEEKWPLLNEMLIFSIIIYTCSIHNHIRENLTKVPLLYVPVQMYLNHFLGFLSSSKTASKVSLCHPVSLTQSQYPRKIVKLKLTNTC